MRCSLILRHPNTPRHDAFCAGLRAVGFQVHESIRQDLGPEDLLVVWNRYGVADSYAVAAAKRGCPVIVAENGYVGTFGETYALALDHHNGAGRWHIGPTARPLPADVAAWRPSGDHILVLPQRGIGPPGVAMPKTWTRDVVTRLKRNTDRPVRVREHPGRNRNDTSLAEDLAGAWAVVTWGSGAAMKAIFAGFPVFYEMPNWIGGAGAVEGIEDPEKPYTGDRGALIRNVSWAQWGIDEIATGEPFRYLLDVHRCSAAAA